MVQVSSQSAPEVRGSNLCTTNVFLLEKTNNRIAHDNGAASNDQSTNNNRFAEAKSRKLIEKQTIEKGGSQLKKASED
jgi:hypothetical protein